MKPAPPQEREPKWGLVVAALAAVVVVTVIGVTMWPRSEPAATVAKAPEITPSQPPLQSPASDPDSTRVRPIERPNDPVTSAPGGESAKPRTDREGTPNPRTGATEPGPGKPEVASLTASNAADMFYAVHDLRRPGSSPSNPPEFGATVTPTGLHYRIRKMMPNGVAVSVDPASPFKTGDELRLSFESNIDGYLYILHQGTSGTWTTLFPASDMNNGSSRIRAFQELQIPTDPDEVFTLDSTAGTERLFVYLSKVQMGAPEPNRPARQSEGVLLAQASPDDFPKTRDLVRTSLKRTAGAPETSPDGTFIANAQNGGAVMEMIVLVHK